MIAFSPKFLKERHSSMAIFIVNHRTSQAHIQQRYGDAHILDVTSKGIDPWIRFSPFYPHGDIPVPFSPGYVSASVEGIWQGLKVFESMDVDPSKFTITTMKGIKRSTRRYGNILGHRAGVTGDHLLPYVEARRALYLPSYSWILTHQLEDLLQQVVHLQQEKSVVLLDYETNDDIENTAKPLSHAALIKAHLEDRWPM